MNGPQHYAKAEAALKRADEVMDADTGWRGHLTMEERLAHRMSELAEAQVHATLALVAAQVAHSGNSVPKVWAEALKP